MGLTLEVIIPSCGGHEEAYEALDDRATRVLPIRVLDSTAGTAVGWLPKVQFAYETSKADIIAYLHSDCIIHEEGWDTLVLKTFEEPSVGLIGFGGARSLGHPDIYKIPYDYTQLARAGFVSNLTDASAHGERLATACEVATLDSFALIVRREVLRKAGGWPQDWPPSTHCLDHWLSLVTHKLGYRVLMLGLSCTHYSGGVGRGGFDYAAWAAKTKWGSDQGMHQAAHLLLYDWARDILPLEVR